MRIYYAHPVEIYSTIRERKELEIIRRNFPGAEIVNPATFQHSSGWSHGFLNLVDSCDLVVCSDFDGFVTAGVAAEVEHVLSQGKPVYRLDWRTEELVNINEVKEALSITETRLLSEALTQLMLDDVEMVGIIRVKWKGCFSETLSTILNDPSFRRLSSFKEVALIDILSRFYHWWQEPNNVASSVDTRRLKELVIERLTELGGRSLRSYTLKIQGLPKTKYDYYVYLLREGRVRLIETGTLRGLCDDFKIPYVELERRRVFVNPSYPIDLNNPALFKAATHIINEGRMRAKVKDIEYYNSDPVLHYYFKCRIEELGGAFRGPFEARKALVSYADSRVGRLLNSIGVPYGSRSISQPFVDFRRLSDEIWKYHIQSTLTEEGSFSLELTRHNRLSPKIAISRTVDVTDILPKSLIDSLDYGRRSVKDLDDYVQELIVKKPPSMIMAEFIELNRRLRFPGQLYPWRHPRPDILSKTKDDRVTVEWRLETRRHDLVDLVHDYYGMLPGTWKSMVFEKLYHFYKDYRGRRLTDHEVEELHRIKKEYPWKAPQEWIQQKTRELFGKELKG